MTLTDRLDVLAEKVHEIMLTNQSALGLADIWYGDQERVPRVPSLAVEPGPKNREWNGSPRRTQVTMDIYVLVYMEKVQGVQLNIRESTQLGEEVEAVLHANATVDGLVISSYVVENTPGYITRANTLMRASRLVFRCLSQAQLPSTL
jgi:hypothetical protein